MNFTAILPSIYPRWTDRCEFGMSGRFHDNLVVVDNTQRNLGVSRSWNIGVERMMEKDDDWLVIVSAATRFGTPGGDDFLDELDKPTGDTIAVEAGHGVGWHLIAFPRHVVTAVGEFDENFFAYYEDNDYAKRISLAFGLDPPYWHKTSDLDVSIAGFSHGVDLAGARPDNRAHLDYYARKWGGPPGGAERFPTPFNDFEHGLTWWPTPPDIRSIMR